MAFFNRFKKQKPKMDDREHLSALGDDGDAWDGLDDDELKQVLSVKFIEYGANQDGSRIAGLFALYHRLRWPLESATRLSNAVTPI